MFTYAQRPTASALVIYFVRWCVFSIFRSHTLSRVQHDVGTKCVIYQERSDRIQNQMLNTQQYSSSGSVGVRALYNPTIRPCSSLVRLTNASFPKDDYYSPPAETELARTRCKILHDKIYDLQTVQLPHLQYSVMFNAITSLVGNAKRSSSTILLHGCMSRAISYY